MLSAMQIPPRRRALLMPVLVAAATLTLAAQAPVPQPSFEVASIRLESPHSADDLVKGIGLASMNSWPTHRYFSHFFSLEASIAVAYDIDPRWISGSPDWLSTQLYSIDATLDGDRQLNLDEMRPLVRGLLEQRFHLKAHHETRIAAGYELVVAKNGPHLSAAKSEAKSGASIWSSGINGPNVSMSALAFIMEVPIGQPVVDKTGLTGSYDIHLSYAPLNNPNADSNLPDIFTAVQEQLGLKLVPAKVPVDYLVIDHVDRVPTEN